MVEQMSKLYEFKTLSGRSRLLMLSPDRIYDIQEFSRRKLTFAHEFPWIKLQTLPYVRFKHRKYSDPRPYLDTEYEVDGSIYVFCEQIGIEYDSLSEAKFRCAVKYGESD